MQIRNRPHLAGRSRKTFSVAGNLPGFGRLLEVAHRQPAGGPDPLSPSDGVRHADHSRPARAECCPRGCSARRSAACPFSSTLSVSRGRLVQAGPTRSSRPRGEPLPPRRVERRPANHRVRSAYSSINALEISSGSARQPAGGIYLGIFGRMLTKHNPTPCDRKGSPARAAVPHTISAGTAGVGASRASGGGDPSGEIRVARQPLDPHAHSLPWARGRTETRAIPVGY